MKKRLAIYTAIYGNTDVLIEPETVPQNCDFYCFTDRKDITSKIWKVIYKKAKYPNDPNRSAKYFKMFPHEFFKDYEYSLWMDARTYVKNKDIFKITKQLLKENNWAIFKHPERYSVFEEARVCIDWKKDDPDIITKQIKQYKKQGFKKRDGLMMATFLFRKHHKKEVVEFEKRWWNEVLNNSRRDQLSFPYCAWKLKFKYKVIDKNIYDNKYLKVLSYKQRDELKDILSGKKKIAVYTAITNPEELSNLNTAKSKHFDFIVFTNNQTCAGKKYVRYVDEQKIDDWMFVSKIKLLAHKYLPQYEYSVWIEKTMDIKTDNAPTLIIEMLQNNHIAAFELKNEKSPHIVSDPKHNRFIIWRQKQMYVKEGYKLGVLYDTSVIIRRHLSSKVVKFEKFWWNNFSKFNTSDHVSFNYVLWLRELKANQIPGTIDKNSCFKLNKRSSIRSDFKVNIQIITELLEYILWYINFRRQNSEHPK